MSADDRDYIWVTSVLDKITQARKETRKETLREMGAFIEKKMGDRWNYDLPPWSITIYPADIETLKKGELPE